MLRNPGLFLPLLFIASASLVLGACGATVLNTAYGTRVGANPEGLNYYLPKSLVELTIMPYGIAYAKDDIDESGAKVTAPTIDVQFVRLEKPKSSFVPDPQQNYVLTYDASRFALDRVCMATTPNGLLSSVEVAADDKTGDVIVSVAKLLGRIVGLSGFATTRQTPTEKVVGPLKGHEITVTIDPLNPKDWRMIEKTIEARYPGINRGRYKFRVGNATKLRGLGGERSCPDNSVCYRTAIKTDLRLIDTFDSYDSVVYTDVINQAVTGRIDITRAALVEKITKLGFNDGVLTSVQIKKPSEALAAAKLPLTVVDAVMTSVLAAPGSFFSNFSGLSASEQVSLIKNIQENADKVSMLQTKLKAIRDGDLSSSTGTTLNAITTLKCTTDPKKQEH